MDFYSDIAWFIDFSILFVILPISNWLFVWRLYDKDWQKIVFGFGLGLATPFLNFCVFYILYFCVYYSSNMPLGSEDPKYNLVHSLLTMAVCGGLTCLLYVLGRRKKRKRKSDLTEK